MDIQSHAVMTNIMFLFLSIDQLKHSYLETYYDQLGLEKVFQIWTNVFVFENLGRQLFHGMLMYLRRRYIIVFINVALDKKNHLANPNHL